MNIKPQKLKSVTKSNTVKIRKVTNIKQENLACMVKQLKETNTVNLAREEFEKKLEIAANITTELGLRFVNGTNDGRTVSKEQELEVTGPILDALKWTYSLSKNRAAGDFYIKTKFGSFPVNVKIISNKSKAYNNICGPIVQSSKLLYGCTANSAIDLANKMVTEKFTNTPQNYGLLVVNKGTGEVKWSTLFAINDVYVNPSNGLQFSMETLDRVVRTQKEGQIFIKSKIKELFRVHSLPYEILNA